ncbi:UNVERIFIED_CONTAM: putative imidazolonepropionase [Siphonaria sp. JEL0065]|nr:putative imidazolonepropionase [Siphonaria sp. JEL0065]
MNSLEILKNATVVVGNDEKIVAIGTEAELSKREYLIMQKVGDEGIKAMADSNVFGVLLPTAAYILGITPPPARKMIKMIDNGVLVSLGSNFNPTAHCLSMPFVMNLANDIEPGGSGCNLECCRFRAQE